MSVSDFSRSGDPDGGTGAGLTPGRRVSDAALREGVTMALYLAIVLYAALDTDNGYEAAEAVLAAIIGVAAYASSRRSGASAGRALVLTGILVLIAGGIIIFKATVGH